MGAKFNLRYIQLPWPQTCEDAAEAIDFVLDDEEDALSDECIVVSREEMPALQEYLRYRRGH